MSVPQRYRAWRPKPILDVQAGVPALDRAEAIAEVLAPAGWHLVPAALNARPWRRLRVHVVDGHRAAHLHLLLADSPRWHEHLAFRDALWSPGASTG